MTRLHVMHVIDSLGVGGAERVLVDLANATAADGHRVTVCVTRSDVTRKPELDPRIELLVLDRTRTISPRAIARLRHHVANEHVDVIHAHMRSTAANMLFLRATHMIDRPVIVHDHYGAIETDKSVPLWFQIGHRFASYYVGVSDELRDWARDAGVPAERSITIANPIDLGRFEIALPAPVRSELGIDTHIPVAIVVATLRRDKGIDLLLDALAQMRATVCVLFVGADGDGSYAAACRQQARSLGLIDRVRFLGPRTDVPALLKAADLGILPSRSESGPLVLVEYIAAGLPIVATRVGNIGRRLADAGVPGFVQPGDRDGLRAAVRELLDLSPAARTQRAARGREVIDDQWQVRNAITRWYDVYRHAIAREAP
jgi:glycosyltransferase involved in cell wall biosynthesis